MKRSGSKFAAARGYKVANTKFTERGNSNQFVPTFFMPKGETRKVVFLSDVPVTVVEHQVPQRSRQGNRWFRRVVSPTTFNEEADDPMIEAGSRPALVSYYTIMEVGSYTDGRGNKHRNEKKLAGFKQQMFEIIKRRRATIRSKSKKTQNLTFAVFEVSRSRSSKSASVGDDWMYLEHWDEDKVLRLLRKGDPKATIDELDPDVYLMPPSDVELKQLAKQYAKAADAGETGFGDDDDDEDEKPSRKKTKARRRPRDEEEEDEEEQDEDSDEDSEEEDDEDLFDDDEDSDEDSDEEEDED